MITTDTTATTDHTHQTHADPELADGRCVVCGLIAPTPTVVKARYLLRKGIETTPSLALMLARFDAENRPALRWGEEEIVSEQDGVTITAQATYDDDSWTDDWLGTIRESRTLSEEPPSDKAIDVTDEPGVAAYRPGGRVWFEDAQPDIARGQYEWYRDQGKTGKNKLATIEHDVLVERAKYRANYQSYVLKVTATDADGDEIATEYLGDCASHNSVDTDGLWVEFSLWDTVSELVDEVQHQIDEHREQTRAREAAAEHAKDLHATLVDAARLTVEWAISTPRQLDKPSTMPHVIAAVRAVELLDKDKEVR